MPDAKPLRALLVALALALPLAPGRAADLTPAAVQPAFTYPQAQSIFSEVRLGGFAHGVGNPERGSADVNAEILTRKVLQLDDPFWNAFVPRLHLGATINTGGQTSHGYFGLTWTYDVFPRVFVEASFGGSVNNGYTGRESFVPFDHAKLGCPTLFRESASVGYRFTEQWSVMATIEHASNANLCTYNRGMTNVGVRVGYSF